MLGECHAHLMMNAVDYQRAVADNARAPREDLVRGFLEEYRRLGIFFLRDGGDRLGVSRLAKRLAPEYGIDYRSPIFAIHKAGHYGRVVGFPFETMGEYRDLVDKAKAQGADFIKIMLSGILDFDRYGVITSAGLPVEEAGEMVRIAHGEGLAVMAHVNGRDCILTALEAGIDSLEHGYGMDGSCLRALRDEGAVWVPSLAPVANPIGSGRFSDQVLRRWLDGQLETVAAAAGMGIPLAAGSDAGAYWVPHGQGLRDECRHLLAAIPHRARLEKILKEGERQIRERFCRQ